MPTKIFTYGNILVPWIAHKKFRKRFEATKNVFITGFKIVLRDSKTKLGTVHMDLIETGDDSDIVAGYIVEVGASTLLTLDSKQPMYYRRLVRAQDRQLQETECYVYVKIN